MRADLTWSTSQLLGNIPDITLEDSGGWLVQLYRDAGAQTDLGAVSFNLDGSPTGVGNSTDDVLLESFTSSLISQSVFGVDSVSFSAIRNYSSIQGYNVYTVILDTDSWANATTANRTFVLDESTYEVAFGDGPINYTVPSDNPAGHEWQQVIPEPGTMALLLIGMTGVFGLRKRLLS